MMFSFGLTIPLVLHILYLVVEKSVFNAFGDLMISKNIPFFLKKVDKLKGLEACQDLQKIQNLNAVKEGKGTPKDSLIHSIYMAAHLKFMIPCSSQC